jgi:hypothetical protein
MRQSLRRHPDSQCLAAERIEVEIARPCADTLALSYIVTGRIREIRMPPVTTSAREDELWRHTCFEAFISAPPDTAYYEFNLSPSTRWAAYRFSGYRSGMHMANGINALPIETRSTADRYTLQGTLELDRLSDWPRGKSWRLGLSALIEDVAGRRSYWALAHPPGKPDFHHADSFACEFSPVAPP